MAGGTWTNQNKIRPGVYIRFTSDRGLGLTVSDRGVVAIAEAMSWGPVETVQEIEAGANMTPYTGYDITNPKNRFLNEIFKGTNRTAAPNKLLLYRLEATGQKQASAEVSPLTATAKYPGVRGNDISIVITELTDPEDAFAVSTVVGGEIVDQQTAKTVEELAAKEGAQVIPVCAKLEAEIAELDGEEKKMFLDDLGIAESGLDRLIKASYALLGLISFLTSGEDECRAWTIKRGTKAPQAAGKIHTDFERGFIRAEVVNFDDLMACGSMNAAKEKGLVRSEGKEYVMKDGDIVLFRFNV